AASITHRTLIGVIGGDTVGYVGGSATFRDKNVGTQKTVTAIGLTLSGIDSGNYTVNTTATAAANITPAPLTVSGATANDKVYDATTPTTLNTASAALVGAISGDAVALGTSGARGSFADKNVGTNKAVSVAGLTIAGAAAGNYALAQ